MESIEKLREFAEEHLIFGNSCTDDLPDLKWHEEIVRCRDCRLWLGCNWSNGDPNGYCAWSEKQDENDLP